MNDGDNLIDFSSNAQPDGNAADENAQAAESNPLDDLISMAPVASKEPARQTVDDLISMEPSQSDKPSDSA